MMKTKSHRKQTASRVYLAIVFAVFLIAGCSTTAKPQRTIANIEIIEAVGFTITEDVRISDGVRVQYHEALNLLRDGQTGQGIALLEKVAEAVPLVTAPRIDLGMAYHHQGNLDAAEENLLQAIKLNASHPVAHNELGIVYRKSGRFAEARQSYEAAIAVYPGYHHARRNLAILCDLYLADFDCALGQYQAYMQTVPEDAEASMWIADLQNRMGSR
jgi:tetratricopeptide (TPR) repeat protein